VWYCGTFNRNQDCMNSIMKAINPINVAKVAGSGNKVIYILD